MVYQLPFIMWSKDDNSDASVSGGFLNDSRYLSNERKGNAKRIETIVPVMIRHIASAGEQLQICGKAVRLFTFIGVVRHMEKTTTKLTYEIEDDTGKITAFRWLEAGREQEPIIMLNTYVRIYGHMRDHDDKKYVLILKLWPLSNLNELTNHLLEVTYVILRYQKQCSRENKSFGMTTEMDMSSSNLTKEHALVLKIIQAENSTLNGIERPVLKDRLPKNILSNIDNMIDFFISEGHIYTTCDDNHFKTT